MSIEDLDLAIKTEASEKASKFILETFKLIDSRIGRFINNGNLVSSQLKEFSQEKIVEQLAEELYHDIIKMETSAYAKSKLPN